MKYICLGYYDKSKFDGMTESERNAVFDTCFNHAVQLIGQHPALTYGNIFEIRPAGDMSEIMEASKLRRRQRAAG